MSYERHELLMLHEIAVSTVGYERAGVAENWDTWWKLKMLLFCNVTIASCNISLVMLIWIVLLREDLSASVFIKGQGQVFRMESSAGRWSRRVRGASGLWLSRLACLDSCAGRASPGVSPRHLLGWSPSPCGPLLWSLTCQGAALWPL